MQELREGTAYSTECSLTACPDEAEIAAPVVAVKLPATEEYTLVFYDLETTCFGDAPEIIQLAAAIPKVDT